MNLTVSQYNNKSFGNKNLYNKSFGAKIMPGNLENFLRNLTEEYPSYYYNGFIKNLKNSAQTIKDIKIDNINPTVIISKQIKKENFFDKICKKIFGASKNLTYNVMAKHPEGGIGVCELNMLENGKILKSSKDVIDTLVTAIKLATIRISDDPNYIEAQVTKVVSNINKSAAN